MKIRNALLIFGASLAFSCGVFSQAKDMLVTKADSELEAYDTISLYDTCFDDKDGETFGSMALRPCAWNTYIPSDENTTKSFALQFEFEAYGDMTDALEIKACGSGEWDTGHIYQISLSNTWGTNGVIVFFERNNGTIIYKTKDLYCNLGAGARHTIEFGSIYLKDSTNTFNFVKYDGNYLYQEEKTPYSHERSTKVGYSYTGNNIFVGSTTSQQSENTQILQFSYLSTGREGIYLNASCNNIPSGNEVVGAPVSQYNLLLNGKPMYQHGVNNLITKISDVEENSYYLNLKAGDIKLKESDIISISNEFRFYNNGTTYSMSVIPVNFLFNKNQMSQLSDIHSYLHNRIANHCDLENYDSDKVSTINQIVTDAETPIKTASSMKDLWDLYYHYILELDAIPLNEEKAQEILDNAKEAAKDELDALVDKDKYLKDEFDIVELYVKNAKEEIDSPAVDTIEKIEEIVSETKNLIAGEKTKLQYREEEIIANGITEDTAKYLESYEIVTTTDLCTTDNLMFYDKYGDKYTYHSGGYDDTSTRIATSINNPNGNMIFQFTYESDDPSARCLIKKDQKEKFGAQIFIILRGLSDTDAYRFDIATITGDKKNAGVALATLKNDIAIDRLEYNAQLEASKPYNIRCGAIDLKDYDRTFLFMEIEDELVIATVVDSLSESAPTIRITDSYAEGNHYAKISPIEDEEKLTKNKYKTLLGRLILDEESSTDGRLFATLQDNNIPVGTQLFPVKEGSFKINNKELKMSDVHPSTYIEKIGPNKYIIVFSDYELQDNDAIFIGGYFAGLNTDTMTKSIYQLFDTTFTYHDSSKSWEQPVPTDRNTIVLEAKQTIQYYLNKENYSEASKAEIDRLVEFFTAKVDETETENINALVQEALRALDKVNTLLDDYKIAAKEELFNYKSADQYRDEEKADINRILQDAFTKIDACVDNNNVDQIVVKVKEQLDDIKTINQITAEELANAKKVAKNEIDDYAGLLDLSRYNDENAELLTSMTYAALDDINSATSIEEINNIVSKYKQDVKDVKTKDGSSFDGEKYKKKGCGGSIIAGSVITCLISFTGVALLFVRKIKED